MDRLGMMRQAFQRWKSLTNGDFSFTQFQGSNVHLLMNVLADHIESFEKGLEDALLAQFDFWTESLMGIHGSFGSSFEGWMNAFKGLCSGLDIVSHTEDESLRPGEIVIYFDNLLGREREVHDAFLKCKNVAEPTPHGDQVITLTYSNGQVRQYKYYNLLPKDYTPLYVQISVQYKKRSVQYKDSLFIDHFTESFVRSNRINQDFYPESYMDVSPFTGVADFQIKTKVENENHWVQGVRVVGLGKKFSLESVVIE